MCGVMKAMSVEKNGVVSVPQERIRSTGDSTRGLVEPVDVK